MDEEMMEFVKESFMAEEIDLDYEFDAARYYDFTRLDGHSEAREAESWFESAESYPPSPFIAKLNWGKDIYVENEDTSSKSKDGDNMYSIGKDSDISMCSTDSAVDDDNRGTKFYNHMARDNSKAKIKSVHKSSLSRSSTLMKPTASQLAKLRQPREVHCSCLRRFQKLLDKNDENSSQISSVIESQATKRQKLEAGYSRKVAHLKHQALFLHKVPNKVGLPEINSSRVRPKVTIPREPDLETAHRAQRHRSKINTGGEHEKANTHAFKARPLNRKILKAPSLLLPKKSTPQLPEFQVFHLRTSKRAMQHASSNVANMPNSSFILQNESIESKRLKPVDALKEEKCEADHKFKTCPLNKKEFKFPTDKRFPNELPIELFSKLSLASESHSNRRSQLKISLPNKGMKENMPDSFHQEHEMIDMIKEKTPRLEGKQYQCGSDRRILEIGQRLNINRSLDIR